MHLSRIVIRNFRNFSALDVALAGNVVIVGENGVGKSNLLYALRLIFDATLPDSARQLSLSDFWDGLQSPLSEKIVVAVELRDFEDDLDVLALLTDFRLDADPDVVRLTYEFRPKAGLDEEPASPNDFEFVCFGGEDEAKRFGHDVRRRIAMDIMPALRDAEGDLSAWRRSPLRPLLEEAFGSIDRDDLDEIGAAVGEATEKIIEFDEVQALEERIGVLLREMSGPRQDIRPKLGFTPSDPARLYRNIRLLIDEGLRGIGDASLGSANLVFLSLKALEIRASIEANRRDHTLLAIEEPEAHLHPHLQRSVYRQMLKESAASETSASAMSVILTTHSPHIASVAPVRSVVLLRSDADNGATARSAAALDLDDDEIEDLSRYLDVTRAELLFAHGVVLVEGDAEKYLLPTFAEKMGMSLDHLGITVCSVAGTNFTPYAKFLTGLGVPFSIVTDWDPRPGKKPLGWRRSFNLAAAIEAARTGLAQTALIAELKAIADYQDFSDRCEEFGVFSNASTLEIELFEGEFIDPIIETLREGVFGPERRGWIDAWESDPSTLDNEKYLSLVEAIGKGRFAQRLATRVADLDPPAYIEAAVKFVADRV